MAERSREDEEIVREGAGWGSSRHTWSGDSAAGMNWQVGRYFLLGIKREQQNSIRRGVANTNRHALV